MLDLPIWLNEALIKSALDEDIGKQVEILKFHVENAVPPGNNYLSQTLRLQVEYVLKDDPLVLQSTGFIVKIPFNAGYSKKLADMVDLYKKEPAMYKDLFPKMTSQLNEEIFPKSYTCLIEDIVILKDLKEAGFIMMDRLQQLDFEHCREVLVAIAKLHASSVALHHENPNLIESFGKEFFYTSSGPMGKDTKPMLENAFKTTAEVAKELGCERFSNLLISKVDTIFETSTKLYKRKEIGLNVLNHGDMWTTNVLFKHDQSGKVVDTRLIDYQLTRYLSPVSDLLYFIWTSANEEVREFHQEKLFNAYLQTLNFYLERLGCKERLSAEELESEIKSSSDLALIVMCNLLPFFVTSPENYLSSGDIENFESIDTNQYQKIFRGERFISFLPKLADQFINYFNL